MAKKDAQPQTAVAKPATGTALANTNEEFEAFAGSGMENVGARDLLIPRITILQDLSPQIKPKKAEFIEGAVIGDICDVAMGRLFKEQILFLPVLYRKDFLEWAPRSSGKGLVGVHSDPAILDTTTRNDRNQAINAAGNLIAETAQFFGINLSAPDRTKCFLPMSSTQLKKSKKWMMMATSERLKRADGSEFQPPLWYRSYTLSVVDESNNDGDWKGWRIERGPTLPELCEKNGWRLSDMKDDIVKFIDAINSGSARGDLASMHDDADAAGSGNASGEGRM
jgi:hypothetical protein